MINIIQVIILSIVQGVTEWFPISSSGHLAIFHNIFGFSSLSFDVFLHFASILAVIFIFFNDIIDIFKKKQIKYILLIIIAIIPAGIIGFLFKSQIEGFFSNLLFLGIFFIISGGIVYSTRFAKEKIDKKLTWFDSLFIGIFQAIAILPGISRSGATISSGLFRGLKKAESVRFAFIIAIPVILGASLVEAKDIVFGDISYVYLISAFIITFIVSLAAIKLLLKILKSERFYWFGIYNAIVGILLVIWSISSK